MPTRYLVNGKTGFHDTALPADAAPANCGVGVVEPVKELTAAGGADNLIFHVWFFLYF